MKHFEDLSVDATSTMGQLPGTKDDSLVPL